jgi:type II secretory pathway pseudopilin PulG
MIFKAWTSRLKKEFNAASTRNEAGFTLVEELVAVAVVGLGLVILVSMITTGAIGTRKVNDLVVAESLARSQIELIKDAAYQEDPGISPYPAVSTPPEFTVTVSYQYWDSSANGGSGGFITAQHNEGLQKVTVTVTSDGETIHTTSSYKVDR